jgi:choline dehydrogenase-like flavoprotein
MLQGLQAKKMPDVKATDVLRSAGGAFALAYARTVRSRLHVFPKQPVYLQVDMEQHPKYENAITLGCERDRYGRKVGQVRWEISAEDYENIGTVRRDVLRRLKGKCADLFDADQLEYEHPAAKPYDVYHPVGTCRMGGTAQSVVDFDLKVHGTENLFVVSTGIFPSAGSANPTFGMLCFANRLAKTLNSRMAL